MRVADFHFGLPEALVTRYPLPECRANRLLTLDGLVGTLAHRQLTDLLDYPRPGDLIVPSNIRMISARLLGQKESGDKLEVLVECALDQHRVSAHTRASKTSKSGTWILVEGSGSAEMLQCHDALFELAFAEPVLPLLERVGYMPLPPYIDRSDDAVDREHYQTIYAQYVGAMAAPIVGLHFDRTLLEAIRAKGMDTTFAILHVGVGTFQSVRVKRIGDYVMHREWPGVGQDMVDVVSVCRARGGWVAAVGTTSMRLLKSTAYDGELKPFSGDTDIFILSGRPFHVVGTLITNFHLPEFTPLMLVSALAGYPETMAAYATAAAQGYRFFSYGDAMFITRNPASRGPED